MTQAGPIPARHDHPALAGQDCRWQVRWLLIDLAIIAMALGRAARALGRRWDAGGGSGAARTAGGIDLGLVFSLLARAVSWTVALRARLDVRGPAVRRQPGRPMAVPEAEDGYDRQGPDWNAGLDWNSDDDWDAVERALGEPPGAGDGALAAVLARCSVREIVAQICEDLGAAATLLGQTEDAERIAAIGCEMEALLQAAPEAALRRPPRRPARLFGCCDPPAWTPRRPGAGQGPPDSG